MILQYSNFPIKFLPPTGHVWPGDTGGAPLTSTDCSPSSWSLTTNTACRQPAWCLCWLYYCGQLGETGQTEHSLLLPDSFAGPDNTLGRASPLRTTCRAGTGPCLPPSSLAGRREDRGRVTTECSYCRRQVTAGGQLVMQPSCHLQLLPAAVELQSRRGKDSHCYSQSGYQEL